VALEPAVSGVQIVTEIATERVPRLYRECLYCGQPSMGIACRAHRDLLTLDPNTYSMRLRATST
jgi:hypothetical protein